MAQQQTNTDGPVVDGPNAGGATASSATSYVVNPTNWAVSENQVDIGPNPDGQSILQVAGLLMSQVEVVNTDSYQLWADGLIAAPAAAPNAATNSVTATMNTSPSGQSGTAQLKIDLLWMIYESDPTASWTTTGFDVSIFRNGGASPVLRARADPLENGSVFVDQDDTYGTGNVTVDPEGAGLTLTRTLNNVQDGDTFTIVVNPYTENDGVFPGQSGQVDVSLAIDARVTMTN